MTYDIVIKNINIIDGSGADGYLADLAVKDGKIAAIGSICDGADTVIGGEGLTLTPGFIDSHSHSDRSIVSFPDQIEKVEQGITFSITGQCGGSVTPTATQKASEFLKSAPPQGSGCAIFLGHGSVRKAVMGNQNRKPTPSEMEAMKALIRDGMGAGAVGMSLGLIYIPGCYADTDEVVELAKVVAEYGGLLSSHIRNEGDNLIEAVEEYLHVIKQSGCRAVFSHHKSAGIKNHGKVNKSLALIDKANAEGADIYLDVYPYTASHTSLSATFFPKRFHPTGEVDVCACLSDKSLRERIKAEYNVTVPVLITSAKNRAYEGRYLADIAKECGTDIMDTAFDLIVENENSINGCYFSMCEEDIKTVMSHPRAMICTDSGVAGEKSKYHPRLRAAFPRAISRYGLPLPEIIRKVTSLPAHVYRLENKGRIAVGYDADICIINADTFTDNADYVNCTAPNAGLEYVIINGKIVLENNRYNGTRAAEVRRRSNV